MNKHVTAWLGAYHDGELQGGRLRQVEAHLAECAACRAELEGLRALTELVREIPAAAEVTPPERFVAQVGLRLPRRPEQPAWRRALELGWRLTPFGLLGAWAFVQAVFVMAEVVMFALRLGLGGDAAAALLPTPQTGSGLSELLSRPVAGLNDVGRVVVRLMNHGGPLGWGIILNLAALAVIGVLYWSWLATWWVRRQRQER